MEIRKGKAQLSSVGAIALVLLVQLYLSSSCHLNEFNPYGWIIVALIPALLWVMTDRINPMLTIGGAAIFIPWLIYTYSIECSVQPNSTAIPIKGMFPVIIGMALAKLAIKYFKVTIVEPENPEKPIVIRFVEKLPIETKTRIAYLYLISTALITVAIMLDFKPLGLAGRQWLGIGAFVASIAYFFIPKPDENDN